MSRLGMVEEDEGSMTTTVCLARIISVYSQILELTAPEVVTLQWFAGTEVACVCVLFLTMSQNGDSQSGTSRPSGRTKPTKRRRLSAENNERMSPQQMRKTLTEYAHELEVHDERDKEEDTTRPSSDTDHTLHQILKELRAMRQERAEDQQEVRQLRQECYDLRAVIAQQQRFTEQLDARDRECNLIVTGVPDGQESLAGMTNDMDKCKHILEIVEASDIKIAVSRLGAFDQDRARPILVKTSCRAERDRFWRRPRNWRTLESRLKASTSRKMSIHRCVESGVGWERQRKLNVRSRLTRDVTYALTRKGGSSCVMESL